MRLLDHDLELCPAPAVLCAESNGQPGEMSLDRRSKSEDSLLARAVITPNLYTEPLFKKLMLERGVPPD